MARSVEVPRRPAAGRPAPATAKRQAAQDPRGTRSRASKGRRAAVGGGASGRRGAASGASGPWERRRREVWRRRVSRPRRGDAAVPGASPCRPAWVRGSPALPASPRPRSLVQPLTGRPRGGRGVAGPGVGGAEPAGVQGGRPRRGCGARSRSPGAGGPSVGRCGEAPRLHQENGTSPSCGRGSRRPSISARGRHTVNGRVGNGIPKAPDSALPVRGLAAAPVREVSARRPLSVLSPL